MDRVIASRSPSSFFGVSSVVVEVSAEVEEGRDKWNENGTGSSAYSQTKRIQYQNKLLIQL